MQFNLFNIYYVVSEICSYPFYTYSIAIENLFDENADGNCNPRNELANDTSGNI